MNLNPTTRRLPNGKIVIFYSPQQIEEIVPITVRQPPQQYVPYYKSGGGIKKVTGKNQD